MKRNSYQSFKGMRILYKRLNAVERIMDTMKWREDGWTELQIEKRSILNRIMSGRTIRI